MRRGTPSGKWRRVEMHGEAAYLQDFLSLPNFESMPRFFEIIFTVP